ncbi:hypothetical protein ABZP36_030473 [Zizania latifolia]
MVVAVLGRARGGSRGRTARFRARWRDPLGLCGAAAAWGSGPKGQKAKSAEMDFSRQDANGCFCDNAQGYEFTGRYWK